MLLIFFLEFLEYSVITLEISLLIVVEIKRIFLEFEIVIILNTFSNNILHELSHGKL